MTNRTSAMLAAVSALVVLLQSGCVVTRPTAVPASRTTSDFCRFAQVAIVNAAPVIFGLDSRNEVHEDFTAFTKSKPVVRPLLTTQFVHRETAAAGGGPMMISCKMKTADHLIAEYGSTAAGVDIGCSGVNEIILRDVLASMTRDERRRLRYDGGRKLRFDADLVTTQGPTWLAPYPLARLEADGSLHLQAKGMRNDWLDPRYAQAPPQFRGTRYCHFVAPEYLRRLLLGEVVPAATAPATTTAPLSVTNSGAG